MNRSDFTSINDIAAQIYRHPLMHDITMDEIVRDTIELIEIVGCPCVYGGKKAKLDIVDYKAVLPCDFMSLNQVAFDGHIDEHSDAETVTVNEVIKDLQRQLDDELAKPTPDMSIVRDLNNRIIFEQQKAGGSALTRAIHNPNRNTVLIPNTSTFGPRNAYHKYTYDIKGRFMHFGVERGSCIISYNAVLTDEDGFPLIVENASFKRALVSYIKMNYFKTLFECGQLQMQIYQNAQYDYETNIAQASNDMIDSSPETVECVARVLNSMLPHVNQQQVAYAGLNLQHDIRIH